MSVIKLTYFPVAARAFPTRFALRVAGIAFEDERIKGTDLAARRGELGYSDAIPLGQLPVLTIDGKAYTQSTALARWAAKKAHLYPTDDLLALKVDEVTATLDELWGKLPRDADPAAHKAKREEFAAKVAPKYMHFLEKKATEGGGPFVTGGDLSVADLWLLVLVESFQAGMYDHIPAEWIAQWPGVVAVAAAVKAHPLFAAHGTPM